MSSGQCSWAKTASSSPSSAGRLAAGILRGMSLTGGFARLVALFGHTATSDNNPLAAGLQCGACGGQGEVNARPWRRCSTTRRCGPRS
ncbi:MAG: DUF2309 family protein [Sandaracinaceae bacterium]|nr:DUF2309 family protein [Sandaracinaceae bacterium]